MSDSGGKQSRFDLVIGAVDKISGPFRRMEGAMSSLRERCESLRGGFSRLSAATGLERLSDSVKTLGGRLQTTFDEGSNSLSRLSGMAGKLSLIFGAAGGGALALARSTAAAGDAAAKAAARAGVGVTVWQEYLHAANLSDVNEEQLSKGFLKLQDSALKAAQGDKTQRGLLKLAGIDPKNARGEVKSAEALYLELADSVKKLVDAGQKGKATNLLQQIMGEEGVKLMPMLAGGSQALKEMRAEAHKLGLVFSEEDAHASEAFNDALTRASAGLKGIGYAIGKVVLPPLAKLLGKFTDWITRQREVMGTGFAEWVESIDIDELWKSMERGLGTLADLGRKAQAAANFFGGWDNVLTILAALIAGKFILSLGSLALAFGQLGVAILTTPVGWFLAAIAAIGGAVYLIYKNWDGIKAWFADKWQGVKDAFSENWLRGIVKFLAEFHPVRLVAEGVNALIRYFTGIDLLSIGAGWMNSLGQGITQKWQGVTQAFSEGWRQGIVKLLSEFHPVALVAEGVNALIEYFTGIDLMSIGAGWIDSLRQGMTQKWEDLKSWASDKMATVKGWFSFGGADALSPLPAPTFAGMGADFPGGFAPPLNMGANAAVMTRHSESVEKQQLDIRVTSADGTPIQARLASSHAPSNVSLQTGRQNMPGGL